MRSRVVTRVAILLAVGAIGVVASAGPAAAFINPTFQPQDVYFHCPGPTPLQNLNNEAADTPAPWDTNRPTKSVQDGAGCGAVDVGAVREGGDVDGYFHGTFTGNLRDLTLHGYDFVLSQARSTPKLTVKVDALIIDGDRYVDNTTVNVTPVVVNDGTTELVELSITGLGFATPVYDANGNLIDVQTGGLATEDGSGTTVHDITLYLDTDDSTVNSFWVWDTTEVPSGITFNPDTLAAAQIPATLPG